MSKVQIGSIDLPDAEVHYLNAILKVNDVSLRGLIAEALKGYLIRLRNLNRDRIDHKARELGLTWEECFNLLAHFDHITEDTIAQAKAMPVTLYKDYGQTNLGNEAKG